MLGFLVRETSDFYEILKKSFLKIQALFLIKMVRHFNESCLF